MPGSLAAPGRLRSNPRVRVIEIESLADPRVADYRNVKDAALRVRSGRFLVEGRWNVRRLIEGSRFAPLSLLVSPGARDALDDCLGLLATDTPVYVAPQSLFNQVVGYDMHRGCLAVCSRPEPLCVEQVLRASRSRATSEPSLWVALEGVADADNVGGIFRNALAFGVDAVMLCPRSCDPFYRKAIRTSMGASLCVPAVRCADWPEPLRVLRRAGYALVALDPGRTSRELGDLGAEPADLPERATLVFGAEGAGLSEEVLSLADLRLRIPMQSGVDSLNVACAAGIALHAFHGARRVRRRAGEARP